MGNVSASTSANAQKVKVLCFFKAWSKVRGSTVTFTDSIMITVRRSDDIMESFNREMDRRYSRQRDYCRVGPHPTFFELVCYLTENGRREFNMFRE